MSIQFDVQLHLLMGVATNGLHSNLTSPSNQWSSVTRCAQVATCAAVLHRRGVKISTIDHSWCGA